MAAYGVIGGIIGGAIALAITPLLRKKLKKNNKKKDRKSQEPKSYRPWGVALFLFLIAVGDILFVVYLFWWMITEGFNLLYIACSIIITIIGRVILCITCVICVCHILTSYAPAPLVPVLPLLESPVVPLVFCPC